MLFFCFLHYNEDRNYRAAALFVCFLAFNLSAFKASFYAWIFEFVVALAYYQQAPLKAIEAWYISICDAVTDNFRIISPKDFRILA